ncbi:hypothetical protein WJX84_000831 [Apatococcus fuscideae]|uniref:Uncharacterized protein n=1 Tax=Apatococcus fuscideae TaxID=2026836 RepID=A0AAW1SQ76_9CHLO
MPQFEVASPSREVKLSQILSQCPNLFTEKKISAAEKQITSIDHLPGRYHQAQAASFDGNPLSFLPNYRAQVVCRLPGLQMLDGKAVSLAERETAQGVVQHEGAMLAVMLSSACLCHKLGRAVQMERDRICSALRREAVRMRHRLIQERKHGKREPSVMPSWTEAFVEVMRAQQMTIAKLLGGFEVAKCRAEAHAAKLFGALTDGRRESMDATIHDAQFYSEREAIVQEMQRGLSRMADVCAEALDTQASGLNQQIQELQEGLAEAMHMPDGSPKPLGLLQPTSASQAADVASLPQREAAGSALVEWSRGGGIVPQSGAS